MTQENEESEADEQIVCPECGGNLVDTEHGGTVCEDCGLVVEEDEIDSLESPPYEENRKKLSESTSNSSLSPSSADTAHTLYKDATAQVEVEYEYIDPPDGMSEEEAAPDVKEVNSEIIEIKLAPNPALYCECGENFEEWGQALNHLKTSRINDS